ncbi:glycoside hydrolase family 127 protein [Streptacidiphilus sp. MAP12-20]|uniref:glycoside hydrolase family 127 protein n=1 Tax=Streptacidiphilus sp. MAP12-20 TaxID=3156299 RepID=UPI0035120D1A
MTAQPHRTDRTDRPTGPVRPTARARTTLRPVDTPRLTGGFWAGRRRVNAEAAIPQGPALLESAGNLHDLRLAAGTATGPYRGELPFMDSDVYKWLEAASWQLGPAGAPMDPRQRIGLAEETDRIIALVEAAQQPDGYLSSWFQVARPGERYRDLRWGHELYCAGHLIQAGVAHHRSTGRRDLLDIARRFADHLDQVFGPDKRIDGICGHPEIETALVELARETDEPRYLALARYFVDRRGHGLLADAERRVPGAEVVTGPGYCQDRVPIRQAEDVEGHAVRQLYLLAGATDVAAETDDPELWAALTRLWSAMTAAKTHLTGGLGAHHDKEDFGDPFELPTERAYCETCAAVASVQWNWRMSLLTGEARYADLAERTLYNALLAGVSLDGTRWLYVNPLQVRDGYRDRGSDQGSRRTHWFRCACCPPNVMRLLAALPHYLVSSDGEGLQLHQYATGSYAAALGEGGQGGEAAVAVETDYPWQGRIAVTVESTPEHPWTLSLRVPQWCDRWSLQVDGQPAELPLQDGWLRVRRAWTPGETLVLDLDLEPRLVTADPRVDAVRGCVAVERGPLVYCLEQVDHPGGGLDDVVLDADAPLTVKQRPDLLGGVSVVVASGHRRPARQEPGWWPYRRAEPQATVGEPLELTAIPYYAWANREAGSMRVWLPTN